MAIQRIRDLQPGPQFHLEEAPAPQRLAPDALALTAEVWTPDGEEAASGRFVLLHDPDGTDEWDGTFRAVVFVRADLETDLASDPLAGDVAWSWLIDALAGAQAMAGQLGGTVSRTFSSSFGTMDERPAAGSIEIRASWTPRAADDAGHLLPEETMDRHAWAWLNLLELAAGMVPVPRDVTRVDAGRRRHRG